MAGQVSLSLCYAAMLCLAFAPSLSAAPALTLPKTSSSSSSSSSLPSFLFLLGDDIGWSDFGYNNGTAHTPHIDALARADSSVRFMDFHSGGTVCSPTRATVLTGRNHFRDCVNFVYDCSDMTECVPSFSFAPNHTFTVPMAVRAAHEDYRSGFFGKWHLGSFYNDSEKYNGITSSPVTHGFDMFNATVEVAPTATTNCNCNPEWESKCIYGHDINATHCNGDTGPGGNNCCFNYWWNDDSAPHAVTNYTEFIPQDDTQYLTSAFETFLRSIEGKPFFAQISFHNCHIPYVGMEDFRRNCQQGKTCRPGNYSSAQLDYFSCLTELDNAVGRVMDMLVRYGYASNTMTWLTTDNGPEGDCDPEGHCNTQHYEQWPGSAGPLRGRKRDIWEGGHRVPGIVSWPGVVKENRESWDTVVTMDFLATVMEVLGVSRPASQATWAFDGVSIMPILTGNGTFPERSIGWMFEDVGQKGFRHGRWKLVDNTKSCSRDDCKNPLLYDLSADIGELHDVSAEHPEIFKQIQQNMTNWLASVDASRMNEQGCPPVWSGQ